MPIILVFAYVLIQDIKIASNSNVPGFNVQWNEAKITLTI